MAQNVASSERDQLDLLAPSLSDWLPEDHLAWFLLDCVEEMDLPALYTGSARTAEEAQPITQRPCSFCSSTPTASVYDLPVRSSA